MKFVRLILFLALTGVFLFLGYYLFQRQQNKYSFLSFKLNNAATSVLIPDLDRLLNKLDATNEIKIVNTNETLKAGLKNVLLNDAHGLNTYLGEQCFLSFDLENFAIAFKNPDLNFDDITNVLAKFFKIKANYKKGIFEIGQAQYKAKQYGIFTVISSVNLEPNFDNVSYLKSNADFRIFKDSTTIERYILANNTEFKVWNTESDPVRGAPVVHNDIIKKIPQSFEALYFYGSHRMNEDKNSFFNAPQEEAFSWVDNGILILKKDSYELMIAPQNEQRNLRLILEEQTLAAYDDTVQIDYLSVKNFKIMPFTTEFNWQNSIPELQNPLKYYTEFENFNILANSLEAMHWYLSEIQIGNLLEEDNRRMQSYLSATPLKCHYVAITNTGSQITFETAVWMNKTKCTKTIASISLLDAPNSNRQEMLEFATAFKPTAIAPFTQKNQQKLVVSNASKIAVYNHEGAIEWQVSLSEKMILAPQLIDLENDGIYEVALFLNNQFKILNNKGKFIEQISYKTNQKIKGGLCVNYDNKYDYRFFIITQAGVICLNEKGKIVVGWQFSASPTPLAGEAAYTQINGIDFLTFKAVNDQLFVLNRKGENKFDTESVSKLPNESQFVTGKNETLLHKLGYANQYIYNRFLKDGYTDSVKLDIRVNAVSATWLILNEPMLLIEEPARIILFNKFGYVEQEILKPQGATKFLGVRATPEIHYVFFGNSNNSLYLLNKDGKLILSNLMNKSEIFGISPVDFYTFDGRKIKQHKLK